MASSILRSSIRCFFFFNDTATTEIYTLSLHDALPISYRSDRREHAGRVRGAAGRGVPEGRVEHAGDRKSTRLNSSHSQISYAVFCLKKKNPERDWCRRAAPERAFGVSHTPFRVSRTPP